MRCSLSGVPRERQWCWGIAKHYHDTAKRCPLERVAIWGKLQQRKNESWNSALRAKSVRDEQVPGVTDERRKKKEFQGQDLTWEQPWRFARTGTPV